MSWLYIPICVRLRSKHETETYSGIHLVYVDNEIVVDERTHFIYHGSDISDYQIYVSTPQLGSHEVIRWYEVSQVYTRPIFSSHKDPLYDCLKFALENGFNLFPLNTFKGNSLVESVQLVELSLKQIFNAETKTDFSPFTYSRPNSNFVTVRSFPFSESNASMFADFRSTGSVALLLESNGKYYGCLSDLRYLDNMAGGVVTLADNSVTGLVLGNLRKLNGDGDLTVFLSWESILSRLSLHVKPNRNLLRLSGESDKMSPVMLVRIKKGSESLSWGSCVKLTDLVIVTNLHVVKPLLEEKGVIGEIVAHNSAITVDYSDVKVPFNELDLAFIMLSDTMNSMLLLVAPAIIGNSLFASENKLVTSVGYGLFMNSKIPLPLSSRGYISALKTTYAFRLDAMIPTMTISSSSCWNGSSGGGIFNVRGELIGIICSNAQVYIPSIESKKMSGTEKVSLFCLSIPIELVLKCLRIVDQSLDASLQQNVKDLWNLETRTTDIYDRDLKL